MNEILDIGELVHENKRQEGNRLTIFEEILKKCHALIRRYNKQRIRSMYYNIPYMIMGKPKYDIEVLRNYLIYHLRDNGLYVELIGDNTLYISWKETDIDLSKYLNRKTIIDNRDSSLYNVDGAPSHRLDSMGVSASMQSVRQQMDMLKFRQERQKQLSEEREARFRLQRQKMPSATQTYGEYMKRY